MEDLSGKPESHSFSGHDLAEELKGELEAQPASAEEISAGLMPDFYQTFRLSQGDTENQPTLFTLLAEQHHLAGHAGEMSAALELASVRLSRLRPPARHRETTEETRNDNRTGFGAMWGRYSEILQDPSVGPRRSSEQIVEDMLVDDQSYQRQPRPNRTEKDDPHESIVREYILGDRLTGSPQLLAVRDSLRQTLLSSDINDKESRWVAQQFQQLARQWEANHPEQSFVLQAEPSEA